MATLPTRSAKGESSRLSACVAAARALEDALSAELKPIPEGWFSRQMFSEATGLGHARASEKITDMKRLGLVDVQNWKIKGGVLPIYRKKQAVK